MPSHDALSVLTLSQLSGFALGTLFFFLAVQRPLDWRRHLLSTSHVLIMAVCLARGTFRPTTLSSLWVSFVLGATIHTSSLLMVKRTIVPPKPVFRAALRDLVRVWTNLRRVPLVGGGDEMTENAVSRCGFALLRGSRTLGLWLLQRYTTRSLARAFSHFHVTLWDFDIAKQGLFPLLNKKDICLRIIFSVHWIWITYVSLTISHDMFAILFVVLLRWDLPREWPELFGSISEAYSVRRFWGVFWHKLHVAPFASFTPAVLSGRTKQRRNVTSKASRALWILMLSGACHAIVSWTLTGDGNTRAEMRFFITNYVVCLLEPWMLKTIKVRPCLWVRVIGYIWVLVFFFCVVPAWQYPRILVNVRGFG
ncbi:hypothetical protein F4778DRAFT_797809 [Xylariomycetidae sp. FL2044]|nr:hypothetical protein F4778DRAFT_797809 [Xylariomycetidae sp. FL2044]